MSGGGGFHVDYNSLAGKFVNKKLENRLNAK
jgi:hypothetical protein